MSRVEGQCSHRIDAALLKHLSNGTTCPPCLVSGHIKTIKSVQETFSNRGGIFVSRPHIKRDPTHPEWSAHLGLRERWRDTKIELLNSVMLFEKLAQSEERREGWEPIDEALQLWERESDALAEMPGYGKVMTEQDVGDIVKRMMDQLKGTVEGLIQEHENEQGETDDDDEGEEESCPFPDSDLDTDSEDEEMPDAFPEKPRLEDIDPAHTEAETEIAEAADADIEADVSTPPNEEAEGLTRKRKLRFTDFATVCPDSLTFVPSRFPHMTKGIITTPDSLPIQVDPSQFTTKLSSQATLQPHRRRTESSSKRLKSRYGRHRSHYSAGMWASPPGYEKPNTSFYRMTWDEAERAWRENDREIKAEKRAYKKLKGVSGTWVLMRVLSPALWSLEESLKHMQQSRPPGVQRDEG